MRACHALSNSEPFELSKLPKKDTFSEKVKKGMNLHERQCVCRDEAYETRKIVMNVIDGISHKLESLGSEAFMIERKRGLENVGLRRTKLEEREKD